MFKSNIRRNNLAFEETDGGLVFTGSQSKRRLSLGIQQDNFDDDAMVGVSKWISQPYMLTMALFEKEPLFFQIESLLMFSGFVNEFDKPYFDYLASATAAANLEKMTDIAIDCELGTISSAVNMLGEERYIRPLVRDEKPKLIGTKKIGGLSFEAELECLQYNIHIHRYVEHK